VDESSRRDRVAAAVSRSLIADLSEDTQRRILAGGIPLRVPAGSVIYRASDEPQAGLVVDGLIRVYLASDDGRQLTVRYARPGDLLGIPTVIGGPVGVSSQALTDASLLVLNHANLRTYAIGDASLSWRLAEEVTRRLYDVLEAFSGSAFGTVRQRLARHLLDIAAQHQTGVDLVVRLSGQALADSVGTAREVVARTLHDLRAAGIVGSEADGIRILEPELLEEIAQTGRVTSVTGRDTSGH
jgi:CRP/FNR family transcriptional regulator, cyclic AMP receptor protein